MPRRFLLVVLAAALCACAAPRSGEQWRAGTYAGDGRRGDADGPLLSARFDTPSDVVVSARGVVYVADSGNHVVRRIDDGVVSTLHAGPLYTDGANGPSTPPLAQPTGLALDSSENFLYVADPAAAGLFLLDLRTLELSTVLAGSEIGEPHAVALHGRSHLVVTAQDSNAVYFVLMGCAGQSTAVCPCRLPLQQFNLAGPCIYPMGSVGDADFRDGAGQDARFRQPQGVAVDASGIVYVADTGNAAVRVIRLNTGVESASPQQYWAALGAATVNTLTPSPSAAFRFRAPSGIAAAPSSGTIFIADSEAHQVVSMDTNPGSSFRATSIAGSENPGYADGHQSLFDLPVSVAFVNSNELLVVDAHRNLIRTLSRYEEADEDGHHHHHPLGESWSYVSLLVVGLCAVVLGVAARRFFRNRWPLWRYMRVHTTTPVVKPAVPASYLETSF